MRRSGKLRSIAAIAVAVVLLSAAGIFGAVKLTEARRNDRADARLAPYRDAANTFPVPVGARVAFPDAKTTEKLGIVKGWTMSGSLDDACTAWREGYRSWVGTTGLASVTGEFAAGQSCTFSGMKGSYAAKLQVSIYNNSDPQVTLTVTQ